MKYRFLLLMVLILPLTSCEKLLLTPNPETDNKAIFNEYATLVQEKYAMLEAKKVAIIHLKDSIASGITGNENETLLFQKLAFITSALKDGHSSLRSRKNSYTFDIKKGYPVGINNSILTNQYLNNIHSPSLTIDKNGEQQEGSQTKQIKIAYGPLLNYDDIGYIRIPSFNIPIQDELIEKAFASVANTKGLIMDIRGNIGGDPTLAVKFASYFIETPLYTGYEKFKNGPGEKDFAISHITMQPTNNTSKYLNKPVYVLTDRGCYSATTTFCYSIDPLPNVQFIGQRTGGGSGGITDGYLANGWYWSLSTTEFIDTKNRHLDNGFEPDIQVMLNNNDTSKDEVLEKAIKALNKI